MPLVKMPDGTDVDLPENLSPEQGQRLRALIASQHGDTKEEKPPERDLKSGTAFATGNVNKGIASALGAPVDLAQDVLNLGKAAVGTAAIAAGRKDLAPETRDDAIGGSKWFEHLMASHRMINEEAAKPRNLPEKIAAAGLQLGGNVLGGAASTSAAIKTAGKVENLVKNPPASGIVKGDEPLAKTIRDSREAGYKFPPSQVNPSFINKRLEGFAGKVQTRQELSLHNADVSNNLAKDALKVSRNTPLSEKTMDLVKQEQYAVYDKVRGFDKPIVPDTEYARKIGDLGGEFAELEKRFPGLTKNGDVDELKKILLNANARQGMTASEAVDLSRVLRNRATGNFKAYAKDGKPEALALGQAQRDAAEEVEKLMDRKLKDAGKTRLYEDWRNARKQLAIAHDIESALNPATGNIDERIIAGLARKGRPLSGPLEKIANFARAFPHASQTPERVGGIPDTVMDKLLGLAGAGAGAAMGGAEGAMLGSALGYASQPAARSFILSDPYQNFMVAPKK